jgi:hypothetical protein
MPNYKEVERLLENMQPFKHSRSMSAFRTSEEYLVYSYSTLIATFTFATNKWELNEGKYSVTTSKQQNILRRVIKLTTH